MKFLLPILIALLLALSSCGKKEKESAGETQLPPTPAEPGAFAPELLLDHRAVSPYTVQLEEIRSLLSDAATPVIASLVIVIECANAASEKTVKSSKSEIKLMISGLLAAKSSEMLNSTGGKMQLREEIIQGVRDLPGHPLVRQVYFSNFKIAPGER